MMPHRPRGPSDLDVVMLCLLVAAILAVVVLFGHPVTPR